MAFAGKLWRCKRRRFKSSVLVDRCKSRWDGHALPVDAPVALSGPIRIAHFGYAKTHALQMHASGKRNGLDHCGRVDGVKP
ncbi:uncharacterized protein FOMMEDRAFT_166092 [Fomitiporia mediterranea MF3/22]|uniref:uncharacterized protein n=1 Tax=Fomitiporia mediterranea (strain MF3/22) TaxID=694068 RepID=UPI0004408B6F|nr:uncharacterized protein FOMMEDRAFT_166092 [Fomitiporia mediterranea MF3/22]EJD05744.1 hypothetical protein FOMMEDRAFT_166092 [Fomitiporia mediterranea MF3/22]